AWRSGRSGTTRLFRTWNPPSGKHLLESNPIQEVLPFPCKCCVLHFPPHPAWYSTRKIGHAESEKTAIPADVSADPETQTDVLQSIPFSPACPALWIRSSAQAPAVSMEPSPPPTHSACFRKRRTQFCPS